MVRTIECPECGEEVPAGHYSFTDGMCWDCREIEDADMSDEDRDRLNTLHDALVEYGWAEEGD